MNFALCKRALSPARHVLKDILYQTQPSKSMRMMPLCLWRVLPWLDLTWLPRGILCSTAQPCCQQAETALSFSARDLEIHLIFIRKLLERGEQGCVSLKKTIARACAVWCNAMNTRILYSLRFVCWLSFMFLVFFLCNLLKSPAPCSFLHAYAFSGRIMQVKRPHQRASEGSCCALWLVFLLLLNS